MQLPLSLLPLRTTSDPALAGWPGTARDCCPPRLKTTQGAFQPVVQGGHHVLFLPRFSAAVPPHANGPGRATRLGRLSGAAWCCAFSTDLSAAAGMLDHIGRCTPGAESGRGWKRRGKKSHSEMSSCSRSISPVIGAGRVLAGQLQIHARRDPVPPQQGT